jgi:non-canonical (house-cleaning) NTP pyrophosphatase
VTRLEVYGAVFLLLVLAIGAAYFKGCRDTERRISNEQAVANVKALEDSTRAAEARAIADDSARAKADQFRAEVEEGIENVRAKFARVPTVVVDDRGCQRLTDAARLRWNAVELLPAGSTLSAAGESAAAVPAEPVPSP